MRMRARRLRFARASPLVAKSNEREIELMLANMKDVTEHSITAGVAAGAAAH